MVCNNAGILDEAKWEKTVSINLTSVIRVSYLAYEQEERVNKLSGGKRGAIVNIASMGDMVQILGVQGMCASTNWEYLIVGSPQ